MSPKRAGKTLSTVADYFHQIKEQIGREDYTQPVCQKIRRLEGFLYEAAKNFFLKFKIKI
jgi:hypothetical protein